MLKKKSLRVLGYIHVAWVIDHNYGLVMYFPYTIFFFVNISIYYVVFVLVPLITCHKKFYRSMFKLHYYPFKNN